MEKPILFYEVRPQVNRATGATILVPAIVDREQAVPLDEIIRRAIDRGLIAGVKETYAHQIAEAIAQQMYEEFKAGRGVKFGTYFYARLYLDGTSDASGNLTAKNGINVRFVNGNSFRLSLDQFSFSNVNGGDIPGAEFLISDVDGAQRGILKPEAAIMLNGVNLFAQGDAGTKVAFYEVNAETGEPATEPTAEVTEFTSRGPNMLVFAWVEELVPGKTYFAVPSRSKDGEVWFTGAGKDASVEA
jgi:hypothetical protein